MIDIREYYEDDAGEKKPGKKGKLHQTPPPFGGNLNWNFLKLVHITEDHNLFAKIKILIPAHVQYILLFVGI